MNQLTHIAIIMDGNGRWSENFGLPRTVGHIVGSRSLMHTIDYFISTDAKYLTCYAMSYDNLGRCRNEVSTIINVMLAYLTSNAMRQYCLTRGIRIKFIGMLDMMGEKFKNIAHDIEKLTAKCDKFFLNIAIAYSGRMEVLEACKSLMQSDLSPDAISISDLLSRLYDCDTPNPDVVMRTGNEQRMSDFLLMQSAYSELFFLNCMWPQISRIHLEKVIKNYTIRHRRYGLNG